MDQIDMWLQIRGGGEPLEVLEMKGREAISSLFEFELDVVRLTDEALPEDVAAGRPASLVFSCAGEALRTVHGILESVTLRYTAAAAGRRVYRLRLVPRAWRSHMVATQQIFMDLSVPETLQRKLELVGLKGADVALSLLGDYSKREFIVQFREHDIHFISRLAEHLGVAYHFRHNDGADQIVFSDHNGGFFRDPACSSILLSDRVDQPGTVQTLERNNRMIPGMYVVYDYNYRNPDLSLLASEKMPGGVGGVVEYGAHVKTDEEAGKLAAIRAEELHCRELSYSGTSSVLGLTAGLLTQLEGSDDLGAQLLITEVEHRVEAPSHSKERSSVYTNRFCAVTVDRTFRPARVTPRPTVSGFVTGVVLGQDGSKDGKYAQLDDHGRYIIEFHFDSALGKLNAKASRPVRMAQPFAGAGEGMHMPLKPGTEVAIAFAGGDPDRPVIIGALPNHTRPSVVTSTNSTVNKLSTNNGITIQFGSAQRS